MLNARDLLERGAPPFFFPAFWWRVLRGGIYIMIFLPPVRIRLTCILAGMLPYYNQLKVRSSNYIFSRLISPNSLLELSHSRFAAGSYTPHTDLSPLLCQEVCFRCSAGCPWLSPRPRESLRVCVRLCAWDLGPLSWRAFLVCPVFSPFASSLCDSGYPPP